MYEIKSKKYTPTIENITTTLSINQKKNLVELGIQHVLYEQEDVWVLDSFAKEIFLTAVFARNYMGINSTENVFSEEHYDTLNKNGFNQQIEIISRFSKDENGKRTKLARAIEKAQNDFRKFEKHLNVELNNELKIRNESPNKLGRAIAETLVDIISNGLSVEQVEKALKEAENLSKDLLKAQEDHVNARIKAQENLIKRRENNLKTGESIDDLSKAKKKKTSNNTEKKEKSETKKEA